jgi:N-acetylneuraminic acid mutarotase
MKRHTICVLAVLVISSVLYFSSNGFAQDGKWTFKSNMTEARTQLCACAVNGKIYVIGGCATEFGKSLSKVEEYDPLLDKWTTKSDMPTPRFSSSACAVNGKIYVIGGFKTLHNAVKATEEYDPLLDKWTIKSDMPTARASFAIGAVNGMIYTIGGTPDQDALSKVEEYDSVADKWTAKANMPKGRGFPSAGVVNGKIYVIGGADNGPKLLPEMIEYNPTTDIWITKGNIPTVRYGLSSVSVGGKIYAVGGVNGSPGKWVMLATTEEYDPATDKWETKSDMLTTRYYLAVCALNGKIYAIGGSCSQKICSTVEEYDTGFEIITAVESNDKLAATWGTIRIR